MNWWQDFVGPSTVCILHNLGASSMMSFSDAKWLFVCSFQLLSAELMRFSVDLLYYLGESVFSIGGLIIYFSNRPPSRES